MLLTNKIIRKGSGVMSWITELKDTVKTLNANVADLATQEKAKNLRKKLIQYGIAGVAVGGIGVFISFIAFTIGGFSATQSMSSGLPYGVLIPFFLFPIFGVILGIGQTVLKIGLSILIGGETAKYLDKNFTDRCACGSVITKDEIFCTSCGREVRKTCSACGIKQNPKSSFCSNCGNKL